MNDTNLSDLVCAARAVIHLSLKGGFNFLALELGLPPKYQVIAKSKMTLYLTPSAR